MARGSGVALWRQIEAAIEAEIRAGAHRAGERLPTEFALAERFGVNRHTVRQALASLEERAIVRIEQGRGTFVHDSPIAYPVSKRTRFSEIIQRHNREPGGRLLRGETIRAEGAVAKALGLRAGTLVVLLELLGEADGQPISVSSNYFPADRVPGLVAAYADSGSITKALAECGVPDYTRKETRVRARLPSAGDARLLRQPRTRPVLVSENLNLDPAGRPIEFTVSRMSADRVLLVFEP